MRLAIRAVAVLLLACIGLSQAQAGLFDEYSEEYMKTCVNICSQSSDKDYCTEYCQCSLNGIKATGGESTQVATLANVEELDRIAMTCNGKLGLDVFAKTCKANCKGAGCERCDCVAGEMKSLGSDTKTGEFLAALGRNDAAAIARMNAMQSKCTK